MYYIKRFFRNIPTSILMIIGFSILIFMIFNTIAILNVLEKKSSSSERYKYEFNVISLCNVEEHEELNISDLIFGEGNVYINSEVYIQEINMDNYSYGLVQYKEPLKQKLSIGEYPSFDMDESVPLVVVGKDIYDKATIIDGDRYITIEGIKYKIAGVLEKYAPDYIDYTVIIFMDSLSDNLRKELIEDKFGQGWYFCDYHSDKYDYTKELDEFYYEYSEKGWDITISEEKYESGFNSANEYIDEFKSGVYNLVVIFCFVNCYIITNLWIKNRYLELSIRKTFGYDMFHIVMLLTKDLVKYIIISIIIGFGMQVVYNWIKGVNLITNTVVNDVADVIRISVVIVVVTIALQLIKVYRIAPANSMKEVL